MPDIQHAAISPQYIHAPHAWRVADEAARLALVPLLADVGKYCWQQDNDTEWMVLSVGPVVWQERGAQGPAGVDGADGAGSSITVATIPSAWFTANSVTENYNNGSYAIYSHEYEVVSNTDIPVTVSPGSNIVRVTIEESGASGPLSAFIVADLSEVAGGESFTLDVIFTNTSSYYVDVYLFNTTSIPRLPTNATTVYKYLRDSGGVFTGELVYDGSMTIPARMRGMELVYGTVSGGFAALYTVNGDYTVTAASNIVWEFNTDGTVYDEFLIHLIDGDAYTQTWPASVTWLSGVEPALTANACLKFFTRDMGTTWYGEVLAGEVKQPLAAAVVYNAGGPTTITLDGGRTTLFHTTAATAATIWAFDNPVATGRVSDFTLELTNGGSQTQTWPAAVKWDGGAAPTLTAAGLDILYFYTHDGGTTWRGFLAAAGSA